MSSRISGRAARWAVAVALFVTNGVACGRSEPAVRRDPRLNVLLITIDTLRADAVNAGATPWIDRLASAGARFDNARAHTVVTLPSHANILSGQLPTAHGVRDNSGFRFPEGIATLATLLKAQRYRTGAFVSAFPLDSRFGLARGFDVYDDQFADAARPAFLVQERSGPQTVKAAEGWIAASGENRWFCWVHLYEPHFPYEPPPDVAARFPKDPYRGEVAAADAALAPLLRPFLDAGKSGRTLVVLTSDHGEALGDHGEATHGVFAYEPVLKVPLVIYQPRLFRPTVVTSAVGHIDLLPTILDALNVTLPEGLAGRSLMRSIAGTRDGDQASTYFEALSPSLNRRWAPLYGVLHKRTKYIDLPIPELYDINADPNEARNLAASDPQQVARMRELLVRVRRADAEPRRSAEDPETRQRLRSLGYVASGNSTKPQPYTADDDPKRLIASDALLHEVIAAYLDGDLAGALAKCRRLVRQRPDTPLWLLHLALLERDSGNLAAGIDALRKVVTLSPGDVEALSLLGAYLTEAGWPREAVELLQPHAEHPDAALEVLTTHALALARVGRFRDALATLTAARERDPSNALTVVELATVHLMAGERDAARDTFRKALEINPRVARAHSSLGMMAVEGGRIDLAVEHWKIATAIDPREHEKILGLGIALARSGRPAEARACFEFFVGTAPPARYQREIQRAQLWLKQNG